MDRNNEGVRRLSLTLRVCVIELTDCNTNAWSKEIETDQVYRMSASSAECVLYEDETSDCLCVWQNPIGNIKEGQAYGKMMNSVVKKWKRR